MIRINQITVPIFEENQNKAVLAKAAQILKIPEDGFRKFRVVKRSVDARDKDDIRFSYTVDCKLRDTFTGPNKATEKQFMDRLHNRNLSQIDFVPVVIPEAGDDWKDKRPVIIGAGPCGLFAAMAFVSAGVSPIIVERGEPLEERKRKTKLLFETGKLYPESNIQFGEGGAGLFSDGKLNTSIKGRENYVRFVLETFVEFGAPEEILIDARPHIGTDVLETVIRNIRSYIEDNGGTYYFNTKCTGFEQKDGKVSKALFEGQIRELDTDTILLCQGHSARDTVSMLRDAGLAMEKKAFAMGIRIQHPQQLINAALYGDNDLDRKSEILGPASYKLTHDCKNGRSVYSFCMCPGGYVVNASSEEGRLCVNGMSEHKRDSGVANAALVVNIDPEDFPGDVLAGVEFQRTIEGRAYELCSGLIPYENFSEFARFEPNPLGESAFSPAFLGMAAPADVRSILPEFMQEAIEEGVRSFGKQIRGFDREDAILAGVEARTSSPVRIKRDDNFETNVKGLYALGEGAGYAGGITTAAVDGLKAVINLLTSEGNEFL